MSAKWTFLGLALVASCLAVGCKRPLADAQYPVANVTAFRDKINAGAPAEEEGSAASTATPTGWFTLKGKFTMPSGGPPRATLPVNKETDICMPGNKPVLSDRLIVDPDTKAVRDVLVYLSTKTPKDEKWEHESYAAGADAEVDFDQKYCVFINHTLAFRTSQKLKIINSDPTGHNTNIPGSKGMANFNKTIAANSFMMYETKGQANDPEEVSCSIHPWMAANLIARDNPYFAVTKADGTFEIANIPAGVKLEFRIWHEATKAVKEANGVTINKKNKNLVEITGNPGETIEWNVELPPPK